MVVNTGLHRQQLDFADQPQAAGFLSFLETTVWSSPENSPALVGAPKTVLLEPAEQD